MKCKQPGCNKEATTGNYCRLDYIRNHDYTKLCSQRQQETIAEYETDFETGWYNWGEEDHIQSLKQLLE